MPASKTGGTLPASKGVFDAAKAEAADAVIAARHGLGIRAQSRGGRARRQDIRLSTRRDR